MKFATRSHCAGADAVPPVLRDEIAQAVGAVHVRITKGAATSVRDALLANLVSKGWSAEMPVSNDSEMTITSIKSKVGLCLQTGNMARMYADLLKLQKLYLDNAIMSGVMIVPSPECAKILGDNIANSSRLERELAIFKKVIHIPIVVFSIE